MKKLSLIIVLGASLLIGCERKLPYDLKGITKGVAISFTKTPFSTMRITPSSAAGDYSIDLTIPRLQGDYSFMSEARVMCLYTPAAGGDPQYVDVGIVVPREEFEPETAVTRVVNLPAICTLLGIPAPQLGDELAFTADVILNNGDVIPGWTSFTGYTNTTFTRWSMRDGTGFQYRANYQALPDFVRADFINDNVDVNIDGAATSTGSISEYDVPPTDDIIPYGFVAGDFEGLRFDMNEDPVYLEAAIDNLLFWVNTNDLSLLIPPGQQVVDYLDWGGNYVGSLHVDGGSGGVNTLTNTITLSPYFYLQSVVTGGRLEIGTITFVITYP